jgi:hypothetical protein
LIESYSFGKIVIDGKVYSSDVIITPEKIHDCWWRKQGHVLHIEDLAEILEYNPEILIIGTGANDLMVVPEETKSFVESEGIKLIVKNTKEACETYNELRDKKRIIAAFHLTC